ncbi:hypothetical protein RHGRI_031610 [Rhododendron griersonianum]|uniref:Histone-lysine N-methyltransferase ASHR1 n=1 Tax=Rhododendron griersonianum TaxID=479676 RepID=A0AAV6IEB2_9ERIC|nr:hypothetical protein RHGRI_031610 [Rhododendron griersonianum]
MEDLQGVLSQRGLTVSTLPDKGRCLFSIRDFSPGEVILNEEPFVSVASRASVDSRCEWCFSTSNLKRCSACQVVLYCGSTCQKSDWKLHRLECGVLSKVDKDRLKSLTPSIRLMVKLYLRRKLQNEKIIPTTATDNYNLVEALVSRILIYVSLWGSLRDISEIDEKQLVLYAQMANLVNLILELPGIGIKEIAENFSKLACNAHTICDSELRPLGTGLYPVISIINHSCLPNAVLVFKGRLAVVRAVQHIPKGTEVSISYIETAGSTMTRQKALKEQYFFSCSCPRCAKLGQCDDIQESAILEGYRCKGAECSGFLIRDSGDKGFICQHCGLVRGKDEIKKIASEAKTIVQRLTSKFDALRLEHAPRSENCHPDALATLASKVEVSRVPTKIEILKRSVPCSVAEIFPEEEIEDWRTSISNELKSASAAITLSNLKHFTIYQGVLYYRGSGGLLARCIGEEEAKVKIQEVHERSCGTGDASLYR